ncbi:hypothetical protein [Mycobacterium riyadhense]|uniref:hypothetical protein n=1 Tax=Mycobacterium riyadhense TaxID=486698 RepID=UPI003B8A95FF
MTRFWTMAVALQTSEPAAPHARLSGLDSFRKAANYLTSGWLNRPPARTMTMYRVTDRLHAGRTANVPGHEIAPTVSGWLAELGVHSPLVDDLARAAQAGDWPAAYAVGEHLSVEVTLAVAA